MKKEKVKQLVSHHAKRILGIVVFFLVCHQSMAQTKFVLDVETGAVFKGPYNEIRVPGNGGTTFDVFGPGFTTNPKWFYRLRAEITLNERHTITGLFAPLTIESISNGNPGQPIIFQGTTFENTRDLNVKYTFNSYRLTYRYNFIRKEKLLIGAGITAKIRDASIILENGQAKAERANVGPVPLINLYVNWLPSKRFGLLLEGDGFALPPISDGRAFDIFGGVNFPLTDQVSVKAGYRVLEGGVNVESNYNFNWINYASVGVSWGL
jgi:hypothetical protein